MPLERGKSKSAFEHNIKAEVHAGKPVKQAVVIAYDEKRKAHFMAEGGEMDSDHEMIMDHVAMEALHAIERKDHEAFREAFETLVSDVLEKLSHEFEMKEEG